MHLPQLDKLDYAWQIELIGKEESINRNDLIFELVFEQKYFEVEQSMFYNII